MGERRGNRNRSVRFRNKEVKMVHHTTFLFRTGKQRRRGEGGGETEGTREGGDERRKEGREKERENKPNLQLESPTLGSCPSRE